MKKNIQLLTLILILLLQYNYSFAAKYYFSSSGDDSRTAAQAQNPDTPWKSINKLNSIFNTLKPGDEILFKRGDSFYGAIHISRSGERGRPIVIGAYGSGPKPIITSLVTLNGWKPVGNGIYESSSASFSGEVNVVVLNGKIQELGRFPNRTDEGGGYLKIDSHSGTASLTGGGLSSSANFSGGEVVIRKNQWIIDRHKISSHSGNRINYNGSGYQPSNGYGFFIQNHIATLDKEGEWYYNPSNRKLNLFMGSKNPNSNLVQASTLNHLLTKTYGASHVKVENLHFMGANKDVIHIAGGRDIVIKDSDIEYAGENGILSMTVAELVLDNNRINYAYNNGIFLRYGNAGAKVSNNIVENVFPFQGSSQNGDSSGIGIFSTEDNVTIEYNQLKNIGYSGIYFNGNNVHIRNNLIDTYCVFKNDGGGIYSYVGPRNSTYRNRKIEKNIILSGVGSKDGIPASAFTSKGQAQGIFLDDNSNNIEIIGNSISGAEHNGVMISNSRNVTVRDNTIYDSQHQVMLGSSARAGDVRNVSVSNNILFSKHPDQYSYLFISDKNDIPSFGSFENNYFLRPLGDPYHIAVNYRENGQLIDRTFDLKRWQERKNKDKSSLSHSKYIQRFNIKKLGENLFKNGSLDKNINGLFCSTCKSSWVLGQLLGGALQVDAPSYSSMGMPIGSVKGDRNYVLKFKAKSTRSGGLKIFLRHSGSPWQVVSPSTTVELDRENKEYSVLLNPYGDIQDVSVMFISDEKGWRYWMDDIEFKEAEVELVDPDELFLFEYNATKSPQTKSLPGIYVDAKNRTYSGSVTLEPFTSVLLMKTGDVPKTQNVAPVVKITSPSNGVAYDQGSEVVITTEASDSDGHITKVEFYNGDKLLGSASGAPYTYTWKNVPAGKHTITAKAIDNRSASTTSAAISIQLTSQAGTDDGKTPDNNTGSFAPIFINAGASGNSDFNGQKFEGDAGFRTYYNASSTYSNAKASSLGIYQTERFAGHLTYSIPVPNGVYTLKTYHHELWFGKSGPSATAGRRVYSFFIEGALAKKDFDIFVENANRPTELTFTQIEVTDGMLNLELIASSNNAAIAALAIFRDSEGGVGNKEELSESGFSRYINTGTRNNVVYNGNDFLGDINYSYHSSSSGLHSDSRVSSEVLFQTERYAQNLRYAIPVPNGSYTVQTFHIESWFGRSGPSAGRGRRVFDIIIEGRKVKTNFDLYDNGNNPVTLTFEDVEVRDGVLNLDMPASSNNATISGIAIIGRQQPNGANLRQMAESQVLLKTVEEDSPVSSLRNEIKLYPNPATGGHVTLGLSEDVGEISILIHNMNGQQVDHHYPEDLMSQGGAYLIPTHHLENGVYLVTVAGQKEIVKRLRLIVAH